MPDPSLITPRGQVMLEMIPPWFREDPDVLGVLHAAAREFTTMDGSIEDLRHGLTPNMAVLLLNAWETLVDLPVDPARPVAERQAALLTAIRSVIPDPSGLRWQEDMDLILPAGWSYEEHIPGDALSPPADTIRIRVNDSPSTPSAAVLLRILRETIPAQLAIQVAVDVGFLMDTDPMDSVSWYVPPEP